MAAPLYSWRRKVILLKLETTYGVDSTPAAATDGILAMNMTISLEADKIEREIDRAYYTANPFVLVGRRCMIEFDFEPLGNSAPGTAAPCGPLLQACGNAQVLVVGPPATATYNPISTGIKSASIYYWLNDQKFQILGCRGTIDWDFTIKQFPKAHAKVTGLFAIPTNAAIAAPTLTTWQDPPAIETETWTLTVNGTAINATGLQVSQNNEIPIHEGSEAREFALLDRKVSGTLKVYDPSIANFDFWTLAKAGTKVPIVSIVDGGAGLKTTMTMPLCQLELPKFAENDKAVGLEIPFVAIASSAGNDDYALKFE